MNRSHFPGSEPGNVSERIEASETALEILASPRFKTSDLDTERLGLLHLAQNDLHYFVRDAALHYYAQDEAYWEASERLEDALDAHAIDLILEALALVGITDRGIKAEVCRCVLRGGDLLDGQGFMEGKPIETTPEEAAAEREKDRVAARETARKDETARKRAA